jgi:hypothetical protein
VTFFQYTSRPKAPKHSCIHIPNIYLIVNFWMAFNASYMSKFGDKWIKVYPMTIWCNVFLIVINIQYFTITFWKKLGNFFSWCKMWGFNKFLIYFENTNPMGLISLIMHYVCKFLLKMVNHFFPPRYQHNKLLYTNLKIINFIWNFLVHLTLCPWYLNLGYIT